MPMTKIRPKRTENWRKERAPAFAVAQGSSARTSPATVIARSVAQKNATIAPASRTWMANSSAGA